MLRKFLLAGIAVAFFVAPQVGCTTTTTKTRTTASFRDILQIWSDDLHYMHEDLDMIFGFRRRSYLHQFVD